MSTATRASPGQRERNKADKLQRIRQAARELFIEKGYDDATTRLIAQRAGVGLGTLFSYATDKRDLLFLILNPNIEQVFQQAAREGQRDAPLIGQFLALFRCYYRFFLEQPALSRFMLRELTFYATGSQAQRFQEGRQALLGCLQQMADQAQSTGRIGTGEAPATIALALFYTYAAELRRWIAEDRPDLEQGLERLERMLRLQMQGLQPGPGAL